MFTKTFLTAALERAIKTFAQALAALALADGTGLVDARWLSMLSVAGMAAVVSLLTSVASAGADGNPSVGSVEVLAKPGQTADPVGGVPVEVEADYSPRPGQE